MTGEAPRNLQASKPGVHIAEAVKMVRVHP